MRFHIINFLVKKPLLGRIKQHQSDLKSGIATINPKIGFNVAFPLFNLFAPIIPVTVESTSDVILTPENNIPTKGKHTKNDVSPGVQAWVNYVWQQA